MSQCLNPDCLQTNSKNAQFCRKCGDKLRLRERYWAKRILGQGGFGRTFLAVDEDKPSKPPCVIKQFLPQAQGTESIQKASELFSREARQLEALGKHPQIPELFAYFTSDNRQYLVQEFIEGQTLQAELEQNGSLSESQVRDFLEDLLKILKFVHEKRVIHRDIKPENILRRRGDRKVVLIDFGIAKPIVTTLMQQYANYVIGTAGYAPIEQMRGRVYPASDLYSLGVTGLVLLTGQTPDRLFDPNSGGCLWRDALPKGSLEDEQLGRVLDKMVQDALSERYQSVEAVLDDLQEKIELTFNSPFTSFLNSSPYLPPPSLNLRLLEEKEVTPSRYQRLETLLKGGKWREADGETAKVMCQVAGREKEGWLNTESIDNFPCEDLRAIDQLWIKYSKGRFGFSVQKRIYQSLGGTREYDYEIWKKFGDRVGWRVNNNWLECNLLNFTLSAKEGHLPRCNFQLQGSFLMWWLGGVKDIISSLVSRLMKCNI